MRVPAYANASERAIWMSTLYAKNVSENIPAHILKQIKKGDRIGAKPIRFFLVDDFSRIRSTTPEGEALGVPRGSSQTAAQPLPLGPARSGNR